MTKQDILARIHAMHAQLGRFPKIAEMAVEFRMAQYNISNMLHRFVEDGSLIRVGNWYRLPPVVTATAAELTKPAEAESVKETPPTLVEDTAMESGIAMFIPALRWTFLFIGIIATVLASWYNALWFGDHLPMWAAWLTASIFVAFTIMAFELALYLFIQAFKRRTKRLREIKWGHFLMSLAIFALWVIVLVVSIGARVAGQYNQWVDQQIENPVAPEEQARKLELAQIATAREQAESNIKTWAPLLDTQAKLMAQAGATLDAKDKYPVTYANAVAQVDKFTTDIKKAQADIKGYNARELVLIAAAPAVQTKKDMDDAYTWVASALKTTKGDVQFWANLFPAIFLDVIAPVGFTVFFFLRGKKPKPVL